MPRIEAYASELNQVWTNIIDNAIHLDRNIRLDRVDDGRHLRIDADNRRNADASTGCRHFAGCR